MKFCTKIKIRSRNLAVHISKEFGGQYFMGSKFVEVKIFVRSTFFGGPKFGRSNILAVLTF